jgi:uncharacterized protein YbaP (TraB family)
MLWKIEGHGLQKASYLFGTFHTRDRKINSLPSSVTTILKKTQRFYTEIKMSKRSTMSIQRYTKLTKAISLSKRLKPKTLHAIKKYLDKIGSSLTLRELSHFKTWAISLVLANQKEVISQKGDRFMDEILVDLAKSAHIQQAGLETPLEQLHYFEELTPAHQELLILSVIIQASDVRYEQTLTQWYQSGQTKGFFNIQKKFNTAHPNLQQLNQKLNKGLLTERNYHFSKQIDILLSHRPDLSYFFAIGAGHLVGSDGLLILLRLKGYKVTRVHS